MHVHDLLHGGGVGKLDVVKKAAAQKCVGQFFFIVGGDEHQRPVLGADQFAGFVAVKLHAVDFAQQVVWKLDVRLVDFVNQQGDRLVCREGLPQHALEDVVMDVLDLLVAQLRVAQARHRVVFIQPLLGLGGGLDVPLQQGKIQGACHFLGQHGFARTGLAFDQQRPLQGGRGIDCQHQIRGGDVVFRALEFHGLGNVRGVRGVRG